MVEVLNYKYDYYYFIYYYLTVQIFHYFAMSNFGSVKFGVLWEILYFALRRQNFFFLLAPFTNNKKCD